MTCYMCDNKVDGCPDELSFCSEECANAYLDKFVYGVDISLCGDCDCPECLQFDADVAAKKALFDKLSQ